MEVPEPRYLLSTVPNDPSECLTNARSLEDEDPEPIDTSAPFDNDTESVMFLRTQSECGPSLSTIVIFEKRVERSLKRGLKKETTNWTPEN